MILVKYLGSGFKLTVFEKKILWVLVLLTGYTQELQSKWTLQLPQTWKEADQRKNLLLCLLVIARAPGIPNSILTLILTRYVMLFALSSFLLFPFLRLTFSVSFPRPVPVGSSRNSNEKQTSSKPKKLQSSIFSDTLTRVEFCGTV